MVATIFITCIASVVSTFLSHQLHKVSTAKFEIAPTLVKSPADDVETSFVDCGSKVYSPVQRNCVSKEVFDQEMKRLFAALGIDTSIYGLGKKAN